jgi:enoyl-CoA hydratase
MTELLVRKSGKIGHVTLDRPKALNALTHEMCLSLEAVMAEWAASESVKLLLIDATGDKAFCAGGDIVSIYTEGKDGNDTNAKKFWWDEYRLNAAIADYPKPYVAIMDGIVMGGGVGISAHGSHRIVTERTMFAMPECAIGLMPDVGGTYLLGKMPGHCGEYAGLTGARLTGADCIYAGLADHFVQSEKLDALKKALIATGDVAVIQDFEAVPDVSSLEEQQGEIDSVFTQASVANISQTLQGAQSDFARAALKGLSRGAPLSLRVTLGAIREARRTGSLEKALRNEYRFVSTSLQDDGEFIEGIRAAVIDKDRSPKWKYATLETVPQSMIDRLYSPAEGGDFTV